MLREVSTRLLQAVLASWSKTTAPYHSIVKRIYSAAGGALLVVLRGAFASILDLDCSFLTAAF